MSNQIPVVVAGGGITGLSAALHLAEMGAPAILVVSGSTTSSSATAPGMITGGQRDNFTRVAAAHQTDFARVLWQFGDQAFDLTRSWAAHHGVLFATGRRLRLIAAPEELKEATIAVAAMNGVGIPAKLMSGLELASSPWGASLGARILAVQDDGERGGWIDAQAFHRRLLEAVQAHSAITLLEGTVESISGYTASNLTVKIRAKTSPGQPSSGARSVRDAKLQTTKSTAVIAACHLAIGDLIPALKPALVSSADQWLTTRGPLDPRHSDCRWNTPGVAWSAFHNHEWGATQPEGKLLLGGGRILRKWAGFEATEAKVEPKISQYITAQAQKSFSHWQGGPGDHAPIFEDAGLDCHPCDELPIVGPMFGEGRILVATGFMGQGLTLGFYSGHCLAKLLMTGRCDELPRRLWPERLRSLPDQG